MNRPDEPRCQHYVFAHIALRQIFFDDPVQLLRLLHSEDAQEFLLELWDDVTTHCAANRCDSTVQPDGLATHARTLRARPCAIVQMPPATNPVEAHFIGLMLLHPMALDEPVTGEPRSRYFTLERSREELTMLCEWEVDGSHNNRGPGPPPQLEAFAAAIERELARAEP